MTTIVSRLSPFSTSEPTYTQSGGISGQGIAMTQFLRTLLAALLAASLVSACADDHTPTPAPVETAQPAAPTASTSTPTSTTTPVQQPTTTTVDAYCTDHSPNHIVYVEMHNWNCVDWFPKLNHELQVTNTCGVQCAVFSVSSFKLDVKKARLILNTDVGPVTCNVYVPR